MKKILGLLGWLLPIIVWLVVKWALGVPEQFLPDPIQVLHSIAYLDPNIIEHLAVTSVRTIVGVATGAVGGIYAGIARKL